MLFEPVDESAVGDSLSVQSAAYRSLPVLPKRSLLGLSVAERIFPGMAQGVFREPYFCFSAPSKTLRLFQDAFSAPMGDWASFYSCHTIDSKVF